MSCIKSRAGHAENAARHIRELKLRKQRRKSCLAGIAGGHHLPKQPFAGAPVVGVGGVKVVDPRLACGVQQRLGPRFVDAAAHKKAAYIVIPFAARRKLCGAHPAVKHRAQKNVFRRVVGVGQLKRRRIVPFRRKPAKPRGIGERVTQLSAEKRIVGHKAQLGAVDRVCEGMVAAGR